MLALVSLVLPLCQGNRKKRGKLFGVQEKRFNMEQKGINLKINIHHLKKIFRKGFRDLGAAGKWKF